MTKLENKLKTEKDFSEFELQWLDKIQNLCIEASHRPEYHTLLDIMIRVPLFEMVLECFEGNVRDLDDAVVHHDDLQKDLVQKIDEIFEQYMEGE